MVAWMNEEALRRTIATGRATYWSRSRQEYWVKGETSGHAQYVHSISVDCDGDALLLEVDQVGPACHTGQRSCFDTLTVTPDATLTAENATVTPDATLTAENATVTPDASLTAENATVTPESM